MQSRKNLVQCQTVDVLVNEQQARELDALIPTLPSECTFQRKAYDSDLQFEPGERAEVSIISAETVDKMNEVVVLNGLDLESYNGVVFYNHNKDEIVGSCQWVKRKDEKLLAKTEYFDNKDKEESRWYKFVDEVWTMVKAGALKAKSIGFQPLEPKSEPTPEELEQHPDWAGAMIWRKTMLLEYSVCPVGINNDAVVELINKSLLTQDKLEALKIPCPCLKSEDDCVSRKIKWMHENESGKYTNEQIIAIAEAYCHRKAAPTPVKKKVKPAAVLEKALAQIDLEKIINAYLSPEALLKAARDAYKNRGKI